jgi:hypothetical protein
MESGTAVLTCSGGVGRDTDGRGRVGSQGEIGSGQAVSVLAAHGRSGDARNDLAGQDRA